MPFENSVIPSGGEGGWGERLNIERHQIALFFLPDIIKPQQEKKEEQNS